MKAVVLNGVTPARQVVLSEAEIPKVRPGWVLIKIRGFGMNHSEQILRLHEIEADYIEKPVIPGIECVGEIADASDSSFSVGQKIAALMGGMGRSFNGSYAEYALLPVHHVFPVQTGLSWKEFAAVPETYFTAWGSLFECLDLKPSDTGRRRRLTHRRICISLSGTVRKWLIWTRSITGFCFGGRFTISLSLIMCGIRIGR